MINQKRDGFSQSSRICRNSCIHRSYVYILLFDTESTEKNPQSGSFMNAIEKPDVALGSHLIQLLQTRTTSSEFHSTFRPSFAIPVTKISICRQRIRKSSARQLRVSLFISIIVSHLGAEMFIFVIKQILK